MGDEPTTKEPETQNEIKPDPEDLKADPEEDVKPDVDPSLLTHLQRVVMMQQQQLLQSKQNQVMLQIMI